MLYPLKKLTFRGPKGVAVALAMLVIATVTMILAGGASAQSAQPAKPEILQSNKTANLALVNRGQNTLPQRAVASTTTVAGTRLETEPLLLLLFGLVVFIGATTLKYKRTAAASTPEGEAS